MSMVFIRPCETLSIDSKKEYNQDYKKYMKKSLIRLKISLKR